MTSESQDDALGGLSRTESAHERAVPACERTEPALERTGPALEPNDFDAVLARRRLLQGAAASSLGLILRPAVVPTGLALAGCARAVDRRAAGSLAANSAPASTLAFDELAPDIATTHRVAKGYRAQVLLRAGDPLLDTAPDYAPTRADADGAAQQVGTGADFTAFLPLPLGSESSSHGLLVCNHEQCLSDLILDPATSAADRAAFERAVLGVSIAEVVRTGDEWRVVRPSKYSRRLDAATEHRIGGPAAGDRRLATRADPQARRIAGTLGNCAGGTTPWGTVLTCEENVHEFFRGAVDDLPSAQRESARRFGIGYTPYSWAEFDSRFDLRREPNELNRFGWVVEVDPYAPDEPPVKRTALGRFKHEAAACALSADGRVVVYLADDSEGEYLYRFVSAERFDPGDRHANRDLLDRGTLSAAKFNADGSLEWLPLVFGSELLNRESGFESQADVVIDARRAADLVGATRLDRPEGVTPNPRTGRVYAALTKNNQRGEHPEQPVDGANPRAENVHGHILELLPPGADGARDHGAQRFEWEVFLLAGNPRSASDGAQLHPETSDAGWFSCPDNLVFDPSGRMWIATDGNSGVNQRADGLFACDVDGAGRALPRYFFSVPIGAEMCGPSFTPDGTTLFLSVQHPGAGSSFEAPSTRWPDFKAGVPPRDAVVAVTRIGAGAIAVPTPDAAGLQPD